MAEDAEEAMLCQLLVCYSSSRNPVFLPCSCITRFFNGHKPKPPESFSQKARFSQGSVMKLH